MGTQSIRISIVIPTFDRPRTTALAVVSAARQTLKPYEIIVVDDASACPPDLSNGVGGGVSVRLITMPTNRGAAAARQAGVDVAGGTHIAFLDSDDTWLPDKLAAQVGVLQGAYDTPVAVSCGWIWVHAMDEVAGVEVRPMAASTLLDFAGGCWFSPGSTLLLPRSVFETVGPFDPELRRLEDYEWFLRFAKAGGRLAVSDVTGALIDHGRRAGRADVGQAASLIWARHTDGLSRREKSHLKAYLNLEQAAAARNEGRWAAAVLALARSFAYRPRGKVHVRRRWAIAPRQLNTEGE